MALPIGDGRYHWLDIVACVYVDQGVVAYADVYRVRDDCQL
ncbi:MAG TPA: hypothetical protein VGL77_09205 [Armatimonadota bacterium]